VPKQILIGDDRTFTTKIVSRVMTEMGFAVQSAEEVVGNLETHEPPSLFLVDWVWPGMSGLEFVSWLREQSETKSTPLLMVTAQRDLTQIAEALQKGANEYVMKPFSKDVIAEKLELLGIGSSR
jgi:two-component system chemotaxis response regulator CheY